MKKNVSSIIAIVLIAVVNLSAQSWVEVSSGTSYILYNMHFPPGQNDVGYAVGMQYTYDAPGVVVKTSDGGQTWSQIYPTQGSIDGLQAVYFLDANTGFAGGWNNYFIKTTDGGTTWSSVTVGSGIWYFTDIDFWDSSNGVAAAYMNDGSQPVFITSDGGSTWTQATSGISQSPLDICYADSLTLYLVGQGGVINKSTDGGYTWSSIYTSSGILFSVDFEGTSFGVVGGEDGEMLATTNGGNSWSTYSTGYENLWAAKAFTGDSAYIGGTDENMYKTTDGGNNWSMEYNGSGSSNFYKIIFSDNGTGHICGSQGKMLYREPPLSADFEADQTTVCVGSTVNFTDLSIAAITWDWTFEGGTPSNSTDQNPSVTYNNPGVYDVELEVSDGSTTETEVKVEYITVLDIPDQASEPDGETEVCTDQFYTYTTDDVDYAQGYEWELDPVSAGTLTEDGTTATLLTSDTWTGDFTLRVRATNQCGDGQWSNYMNGTLSQSPIEYTLEGGGSYCLDGDGVEITLNGSDIDVEYELYLDGVATGNVVDGTGTEISFGLVTDEGYYSCMASNTNCTLMMTDQVQVTILFPPLEPGTPTGPEVICDETSSDYETSGSDDADTYVWQLSPTEAGTITGSGLSATVEWDVAFTGLAYVSVYGVNDCGDGNPSTELEVSVGAPSPEITGENEVCDLQSEIYEVADHDGSTYTWEATGGAISEGQGSYMVTVAWGEPGQGTLTVDEETADGCTGSSDQFDVTIDNCTGIDWAPAESDLAVFPNPATSELNLSFTSDNNRITLAVFNQLGQQVVHHSIHSLASKKVIKIDISHLNKGLYILRIEGESGLQLHNQFIKK